jgi:glutaredoxin 3
MAAKLTLKMKGYEFTEISLDNEENRIEFSLMFPEIKQMPQIFINGQRVGGIAGLNQALKQLEKYHE